MSVEIVPKGYEDYKWVLSEAETINPKKVKEKLDSMSLPELKTALTEFVSNYVYVGNYTIDDSTNIIEHHRLSHSIPSAWNSTVKRTFFFNGDTLELQLLADKRRLKWIKQP